MKILMVTLGIHIVLLCEAKYIYVVLIFGPNSLQIKMMKHIQHNGHSNHQKKNFFCIFKNKKKVKK